MKKYIIFALCLSSLCGCRVEPAGHHSNRTAYGAGVFGDALIRSKNLLEVPAIALDVDIYLSTAAPKRDSVEDLLFAQYKVREQGSIFRLAQNSATVYEFETNGVSLNQVGAVWGVNVFMGSTIVAGAVTIECRAANQWVVKFDKPTQTPVWALSQASCRVQSERANATVRLYHAVAICDFNVHGVLTSSPHNTEVAQYSLVTSEPLRIKFGTVAPYGIFAGIADVQMTTVGAAEENVHADFTVSNAASKVNITYRDVTEMWWWSEFDNKYDFFYYYN